MRRSAPFLLLALALAGCGGSNHHSSANDFTVASGQSSLSSAFTGDSISTKSLQSAQKSFDGAYASTPNDPRPAMGYGVSTVALDLQDFLSDFGLARAQASVPARLRSVTALAVRTTAKSRVASAQPKDLSESQLRAIATDLRTVIARLTDARIVALETNPLIINVGQSGVDVKLGTVEGYAVRAAAETALSTIDGTLAFDLEASDHSSRIFETQFAGQIANVTPITPTDYLPSDSFGTRQSDAGTLLPELDTSLAGTGRDGDLALTSLASRAAGGGYLTDLDPISTSEQASLKTQFDRASALAAGPTSVAVGDVSVTVNLPAFIQSPPASLRGTYPSLQPATTDGAVTLAPISGSIADPTLGGLVPGGAPDAALYGSTLSIDDTTTQGEVAIGATPILSLLGVSF